MFCVVGGGKRKSKVEKSFRNDQVDKYPKWNGMHPIMCGILKDSGKKKKSR